MSMTKAKHPVIEVLEDLWNFVRSGFSYQGHNGFYGNIGFQDGQCYAAGDPVTVRTRLLATGEFSDATIGRPLQPSEYVVLWLRQSQFEVSSDALHWLPGQWHMKLKGQRDVHVSVVPKAGAVFEYFDGDGHGHLGVVERVGVDQSIALTGIGLREEGAYAACTLDKSSWQALGPVFTTVAKKTHV